MSAGVSPKSVHMYRCQFRGVHRYMCHSREGSWVQVSVLRVFIGTGVSPQRVHGYRCQSREGS